MADDLSFKPKRIEVEKLKIEQNDGEHIQKITSYLGRAMQVEVSDGRILEGRFRCFDKEKNIIISDTVEIKKLKRLEDIGQEPEDEDKKKDWQEKKRQAEERLNDKKNGLERKKVGLVLIPGKDVVKCQLDEASEPQPWVGRRRKIEPTPAEKTEEKPEESNTTEIKP